MVWVARWCVVGGAVGFALACSGKSERIAEPGSGGAPTAGMGAGQAGGGTPQAGAGGVGGVSVIVGGSSGAGGPPVMTGGTSGLGGAAGAAGSLPDYSVLPACLQPMVSGPCQAYFPRFGYDPDTLRCVEFVYGGCGANENNFETREACEATCEPKYEGCELEERAHGCPCTDPFQCAGTCSSAIYELGGVAATCPPSYVGVCAGFGEGSCVCPLEGGNDVCGV